MDTGGSGMPDAMVNSARPETDSCQGSASDPFASTEGGTRLPDQTLTAEGVVAPAVTGPSQADSLCRQLSDKGLNLDSSRGSLNPPEIPGGPTHGKSSSVPAGSVDPGVDHSGNCLAEEGEVPVSSQGFCRAPASSTLKAKPLKSLPDGLLSVEGPHQGSAYCDLELDSEGCLLPNGRTSEEAALDLLTLEAEHSRRNRRLPLDDIAGEQDSGIFDLSLLQQEDGDSPEARELQQRTQPHKPLGLQRTFPLTHSPAAEASVGRHIHREKPSRVKRSFPIPSCFNDNPPLFPPAAQDADIQWLIQPSSVKPDVSEVPKPPVVDSSQGECTSVESTDPALPIFPEEDSECVSDQLPESESSDSAEDSSPDSLESKLPNGDMGKKTQSLPRGSQPHVVYSRDEFCEEYASPQKSKSLDHKKKKKKGGDSKKDPKKSKDRKRLASDPHGDGNNLKASISAPMPMTHAPNLKHKRHSVGPVPRSPTQDAGTDTIELQVDPEVAVVQHHHHQQSSLSPPAANGFNNNLEKDEPLARKSGAGEGSPESPSGQPYSPEVILDLRKTPGQAVTDVPPPKPKRLSLTNQLQKPLDKPLEASVPREGVVPLVPAQNQQYERKTEIAVERQVLLKQATRVEPANGNAPEPDEAKTANPYTVISRYVDGEEELILGALPLQEKEAPPTVKTETPPAGIPKRQSKQSTGARKFRHYACIEPVGTPLQAAPAQEKWPPAEASPPTSKSPTATDDPAANLGLTSRETLTSSLSITLAGPAQGTQPQLSPPVVVTEKAEDLTSAEIAETSPAPLDHAVMDGSLVVPTEASMLQSGLPAEEVDGEASSEAKPSPEVGRSRLNSSADSASTVSIPPQSPPSLAEQDLQGLDLRPDARPSSQPAASASASSISPAAAPREEPSVFINYIEPEVAGTEQTMVTVAMAMMPQPQRPEVTVIASDAGQEVNSTEEVAAEGGQETEPVQQSQCTHTREESTDAVQALSEPVIPPVVLPSVSSKEEEEEVDNEEDEDSGVYDASYRHSDWIYVGNTQELQMITKQTEEQSGPPTTMQTVAEVSETPGSVADSPFDRGDETRESVTTTVSENEFRTQHQSLAYRRVHRKTSAIDYQRLSLIARERNVTIKKMNQVFGFRIQYSKPVVVTDIDKGGAAEEAGLRVGDMVLKVNGQDVRQAPHSQVVRLAMADPNGVELVVGTNVCNTLNLYAEKPVMSGYLHKLGGAGMIRTWKKRWFVLKHDNCLYYYKTEDDVEPLGAIVLCNYTVVKARDVGKAYAFKLTKCKARTYYFYTPTEEEMSRWAKHMTEAAKPQNASDIWLDISTHNVGLPALSIKNPDCHGFLNKMGAVRKNWKRRYCVLKDACLYYYKDMDAQHALGVAHFHGYSIQETEIGSKKFGLVLKPPSDELRIFYFFADHETDRKRWVAAFALSIGRWIKTNTGDDSDEDSAEMLI